MPPSHKKPSVTLSQVPSVKELCDILGFRRATLAETALFTDTTHAFRKRYKCSNGRSGSSLTDWNSSSVQQELTAMAMDFLAEKGNGERFWSDTRRWMEDGDFIYAEDRRIIADFLKQLFWKQNKYALNNHNYIERKVSAAKDQSLDDTTPTQETTQRDSMASTATLKPVDMQEQSYLGRQAASQNAEPKGPTISLLEDERNELVDRMQSILPTNIRNSGRADIFEVPEDDINPTRDVLISEYANHRHPIRTPNKVSPRSAVERASDGNRTPGSSPSAKRAKPNEKNKDKIRKKRKLVSPRRKSDRIRAPRVIPEAIPDELLDDLLRIKPSDKRLTSAVEHAMHGGGYHNAQTSTTESTSDYLPESSTKYTNIDTRDYSDHLDARLSLGSGNQRTESAAPIAPMVGASSGRDGLQASRTFSIPSSTSEPQTPLQQPSDSTTTPDLFSKPRPKVRGTFWIITNPEPNYSEESWNNGQIKGKPLSIVIEEISSITNRDSIEKLKIKLKTSFAQTTTTVHKDAEDHWDIAKRNFEDKIKEAFQRDGDQQIHFQIWIEPLYEQNTLIGHVNDAEKGEIDW